MPVARHHLLKGSERPPRTAPSRFPPPPERGICLPRRVLRAPAMRLLLNVRGSRAFLLWSISRVDLAVSWWTLCFFFPRCRKYLSPAPSRGTSGPRPRRPRSVAALPTPPKQKFSRVLPAAQLLRPRVKACSGLSLLPQTHLGLLPWSELCPPQNPPWLGPGWSEFAHCPRVLCCPTRHPGCQKPP